MKVFISWSGERSRKLADFLSGWLRKLPLTIEPWVSKEAINPGTRWGKELSEALEGTSFGILCITKENQKEPWVNFEAGALSKTIENTYVVPYLIGMKPDELKQPLKQFQAIEANEEGTWHLIETIHLVSGDKSRSVRDLEEAFKMWWPKLSQEIEIAIKEFTAIAKNKEETTLPDIKISLDNVLLVLESLSSMVMILEKNLIGKITKELIVLGAILSQTKSQEGWSDDRDYINYLENLGFLKEIREALTKEEKKENIAKDK